jgi:hypothetical protein
MTFVRMAYFPGVTTEHFDAIARQVPSEAPRGRLFFAAGPVDAGWQVVQIWESRELLDAYNQAVFFPALAALGTPPAARGGQLRAGLPFAPRRPAVRSQERPRAGRSA